MAGIGRPGAQNKLRVALLRRLEEKFPEYNPIVEMAKTANDPEVTPELRFAANKEVAQYYMAKLRAIEVTGPDGGPVSLIIDMRSRPDAKPDDQG